MMNDALVIDPQIESFGSQQQAIKELLQEIFLDNDKKVSEFPRAELQKFVDRQSPRATVVMCSDSRVHTHVIDDNPINDLFIVRNIGNQIATAKGSVEYGIRFLNTPVLLIMGHVHCGAVTAVIDKIPINSKAIQQELSTLSITKATTVAQGIIENIHYQVTTALKEFAEEVKAQKLLVLGVVYDFVNVYSYGYDRLILINLNGITEPAAIRANKYLKGIDKVKIGLTTS